MCLILGIKVLAEDWRSTRGRLFFVICILLACANVAAMLGYGSNSREGIFFWSQAGSCLVNTFYAVNLHFYLVLLKRKIPRWIIFLIYIPPLVIIVVFALAPLSILDYILHEGQWKLVPNYGSPWFYAASGYVIAYVIFAVITIIIFSAGSQTKKEKLQAKLLMANLALSTIIGMLGLWVIPYFNYRIPNVGAAYHLVYAIGLFLSVYYLKFLEIEPSIVADEVIAHIRDIVLLLGPDCRVISVNVAFRETLAYASKDVYGKLAQELFHPEDDITQNVEFLRSGADQTIQRSIRYRLFEKNRTDYIMTDSYLSKVTDRFTDIIGFLLISRVNAGRKQFQAIYRITDRELQIIDLTLEGLSSNEIGRRLGISARTVQSHQEHVYQKLGVSGKVELLRKAHQFNL